MDPNKPDPFYTYVFTLEVYEVWICTSGCVQTYV